MDEKTVEAIKGSVQELAKYVETTTPKVIDELAKAGMIQDGIFAVMQVMFGVVFGICAFKCLMYFKAMKGDEDSIVGSLIGGLIFSGVCVGFIVAATFNTVSCLQWTYSPAGKLMLMLLEKAAK